MPNPNFPADGLLATTIDYYLKRVEDNVFGSKPLLFALDAAGSVKDAPGGVKLIDPLMYAAAPNAGSYAGTDVFATAANTGITAAEHEWAQYYGLLHWTGIEMAKNSGSHALIPLLQTRMDQLEMTISAGLNSMLWADGAGNSGKDWNGVGAAVSASDPSWGDYGGLDRTANTWWKPATKTASTVNTLSLADMANVYNTASEGNDHPSNGFTTQTGFEAYEALLTDNIRYQDTSMGDAGFQNLMFKAMPVTFDDDVEGGGTTTEQESPFYMLNLKYFSLWKLAGVWFKRGDQLRPINADVTYQNILLYGQMSCSNVSRQGVLYDIHA